MAELEAKKVVPDRIYGSPQGLGHSWQALGPQHCGCEVSVSHEGAVVLVPTST